MKENWTYKTFGDIMSPAKSVRCGNRKDLPVLSITMREGIIFQKDRFKKVVASTNTNDYKIVKNGQLVIAFPIDEGLIYTQDIVEQGIMSPVYNIWDVDYAKHNRRFLTIYFHSPFAMNYYKSKLRGSTNRRRMLPKEDLLSFPIPTPPLSEQQRIVEELDLLSSIIEKKKEQLKEYDKLAQSLFYDMFGDPVTNEKGWEVKKLGEVATYINGYAFKPSQWTDKGTPIIRIQNLNKIDTPFNYYDGIIHKKYIVNNGDVLISWSASLGVYEWNRGTALLNQHIFKVEFDKSDIDKHYLIYAVKSKLSEMERDTHGATMRHIIKKDFDNTKILYPPLSLQQDFAERIEKIEQQKSLVQQSIVETQTLFDCTMDKYFG